MLYKTEPYLLSDLFGIVVKLVEWDRIESSSLMISMLKRDLTNYPRFLMILFSFWAYSLTAARADQVLQELHHLLWFIAKVLRRGVYSRNFSWPCLSPESNDNSFIWNKLKVSRDESNDTLLVEINALQNWPIPPFWSVLTWWNTFLIGELGVLQKATSAVQAEEGLCKQHQILKLSWTSKCYPYCVQSLTCCCHEVHVHWLHHLARNKAEEIKRTYMMSTTCNQLNRRPVDA